MSENNKIAINKNVPAKEIIEFRDSRGWTEWHTTANLIKSISIEAAELLELVQWEENIKDINRIKEELADFQEKLSAKNTTKKHKTKMRKKWYNISK